jgi:broad specificity phosphatase PhoE
MGNVFVVRHGQTDCNAQGIIQGPRVDARLSEHGRRQVEALAAAFAETALDSIFTSPLWRARETADALLAARAGRVASSVVPELYEMDYGRFCGCRLDAVHDEIKEVLDAWQLGFLEQAMPGGESPVLAQHRIRAFAGRLVAQAENKDVAVIGHGRINRILLATLTATPLAEMARFPQANAAISHLTVEHGEVLLRRLNDTAHLGAVPPSWS